MYGRFYSSRQRGTIAFLLDAIPLEDWEQAHPPTVKNAGTPWLRARQKNLSSEVITSEASLARTRFKIGDRVRWARALAFPKHTNAVGTVIGILPNDANLENFTMYKVEFEFEMFALYCTQIEAE